MPPLWMGSARVGSHPPFVACGVLSDSETHGINVGSGPMSPFAPVEKEPSMFWAPARLSLGSKSMMTDAETGAVRAKAASIRAAREFRYMESIEWTLR